MKDHSQPYGPSYILHGTIGLDYLKSLPTLQAGHFDNLKIQYEKARVWLSRCTVEDGEPFNNRVTVETLTDGIWKEYKKYEAK